MNDCGFCLRLELMHADTSICVIRTREELRNHFFQNEFICQDRKPSLSSLETVVV